MTGCAVGIDSDNSSVRRVTLENSWLRMAVPVCVVKLSAGDAWTGLPSWPETAASSRS
jgi:hypothetical protein